MLVPVDTQTFYQKAWGPFHRILNGMTEAGWQVDSGFFRKAGLRAQEDEMVARDRVVKFADEVLGAPDPDEKEFNPGSHPQLTRLLYGVEGLHLPVPPFTKKGKTKRGKLPTDSAPPGMPSALNYLIAKAPSEHVREGIKAIVQWKLTAVSSRYLAKLPLFVDPRDGRIHACISCDTETLRLAVGKPPLQQIPRDKRKDVYRIRTGFIAAPGRKLVVVDKSQLEMRILAHLLIVLFKDYSLADDLLAADCHSKNALRVFGPLRPYLDGVTPDQVKKHRDPRVVQCRDDIKAVAYGINYGKGDMGLGFALLDERGNPIGERAGHLVREAYLDLYPGLRKYMDWVRAYITKHGGIPTLLGQWRALPGAFGQRWEVDAAVRAGLNTPMQAGGANVMLLAMVGLERIAARHSAHPLLIAQVHDELVWEVDEGAEDEWLGIARAEMHRVGEMMGLKVPLENEGGTGNSWESAK